MVNGQEGEGEAAEAEEVGERNGEAVVKELSEAGLERPPDGSVNGDEGYAEDEVDNVESDGAVTIQDAEQDTGAVLFHLQSNLP